MQPMHIAHWANSKIGLTSQPNFTLHILPIPKIGLPLNALVHWRVTVWQSATHWDLSMHWCIERSQCVADCRTGTLQCTSAFGGQPDFGIGKMCNAQLG